MVSPRLRMHAPRESVIRANLKVWLARRFGADTHVIDELGIKHGDFRVDVCAATDALHGYEIKSDQDTLTRLPSQAKQFSLVFQRMTLVVGPVLLGRALALVPPWWGVLLVSEDEEGATCFTELREPQSNPKPNYRWVVRLLWRDELVACLKERGVKGYSKLKYWQIANVMLAVFQPIELDALVARALRDRKGSLQPLELGAYTGQTDFETTDYSTWDSSIDSAWAPPVTPMVPALFGASIAHFQAEDPPVTHADRPPLTPADALPPFDGDATLASLGDADSSIPTVVETPNGATFHALAAEAPWELPACFHQQLLTGPFSGTKNPR
jgi:hypothetical protein